MHNISIKKKNNVYLVVQSDPSIAQELVDHFSFDAPGAKFHPLFRTRFGMARLDSFLCLLKSCMLV